MTCEVCSQWAAKTERQWKNRMANMEAAPDVEIAPCYICGGRDWAMIKPPPETPPRSPWNTTVWAISSTVGAMMFVYGAIEGDGWTVVAGVAVAIAGLLFTQQKGGGE